MIPFLRMYETPITLRHTSYLDAMTWNCIASYSTELLDSITKTRPAVPVPVTDLHVTNNRLLCAAQAWSSFISLSFPQASTSFFQTVTGVLGLPIEARMDVTVHACGDTVCLNNVAITNSYAPLTMGHIIAKQMYEYAIRDGYNQLGKDNGCVKSCRAYHDPTGYAPVDRSDRWRPLLEDNGLGFFYRQEHVTPHIGQLAKFRNLPESDRVTRVAPNPSYTMSRLSEALRTIQYMSQLDDWKKIEVEAFDDKLLTAVSVIGSFLTFLGGSDFVDPAFPDPNGYRVSFERAAHFIQGFTAADHDAGIIAWKEKVKHDLVRPTSIIKQMDGLITTWAPGGVQTFPAKDFEAYRRVMPHSEYVSGSSCLFSAVKEYTTSYTQNLGYSGDFPIVFPPVEAGRSRVEPGLVPASTLQLIYPNVTDMAHAGGQSRLYGGMHFEEAINNGATLCDGIGNISLMASLRLFGTATTPTTSPTVRAGVVGEGGADGGNGGVGGNGAPPENPPPDNPPPVNTTEVVYPKGSLLYVYSDHVAETIQEAGMG